MISSLKTVITKSKALLDNVVFLYGIACHLRQALKCSGALKFKYKISIFRGVHCSDWYCYFQLSQVATCGQLLISDEPLEYLRWTGADRRWEASAGEEEEKAQETTACSIMYTGGGGGGEDEADVHLPLKVFHPSGVFSPT